MALKVKQLKDDVVIDVKVNKDYYFMVKETLHFLFNLIPDEKQRAEAFMKLPEIEFQNMQPIQRAFFTISLLIAEIERVAVEENMFEETEVLEPTDEGYVEPTQE
jgi:hypothetical protein